MVWSDPEIQKLSREFVPVADEVHGLYPEDAGNLARVANQPAHQLFKKFGESMPPGDWHHPGTKQGIYMMGPDGEYLEGRFAASGETRDVRERLQRALQRWDALKKQARYANKPVPAIGTAVPCGLADSPMLLRVSLRDLPRDDKDPRRWRPGAFDDGNWATFVQWAWNQNWFSIDDPRAFVTDQKEPRPVAKGPFARLCREVFVDNVRGQAPHWRPEHVQLAELTMRRRAAGARWTIEYTGQARMDAGPQKIALAIAGEAEWDPRGERFTRFELVAVGERSGAWTFNQRAQDPGPAPIGIGLRLFRPEPAPPAK